MIFNIEHLISYISKHMTLFPGDVVITGTPAGVGPMNVGDVVEVEIERLGKLTNTVVSM
jgi:2-keto-4-pentenoate hydratase/2-oxohepta-3-ene-1,7-dioic acid hydratase in catechol pathway